MDVIIVEKATGKLVAQYTINLHGLNYTPSDTEYFSEAWKCAAEDSAVEKDRRDKYEFSFAK